MKFDKKTGDPIPENRTDEVKLTIEQINKLREKMGGMNDKQLEITEMVSSIAITSAMIFDVCASMFNYMLKKFGPVEEKENDERSTEDS